MKLATLFYLRRIGQTQMVHRVKKANDMNKGKWNGLGGKLEAGETRPIAEQHERPEEWMEMCIPTCLAAGTLKVGTQDAVIRVDTADPKFMQSRVE